MRRIPTRNSKTRKLCEFLHTFGPKSAAELNEYFASLGGSSTASATSLLRGTEYAEKVGDVYKLAGYLDRFLSGREPHPTGVGPIVPPRQVNLFSSPMSKAYSESLRQGRDLRDITFKSGSAWV